MHVTACCFMSLDIACILLQTVSVEKWIAADLRQGVLLVILSAVRKTRSSVLLWVFLQFKMLWENLYNVQRDYSWTVHTFWYVFRCIQILLLYFEKKISLSHTEKMIPYKIPNPQQEIIIKHMCHDYRHPWRLLRKLFLYDWFVFLPNKFSIKDWNPPPQWQREC